MTFLISTAMGAVAQKITHLGKPLKAVNARDKTGKPVAVFLVSEKHMLLIEAHDLPVKVLEARP